MKTTIKVNDMYKRINANLEIASRARHDFEIDTFIFRLNAAQEDIQILLAYPICIPYEEIAQNININLYNGLYEVYCKLMSDIKGIEISK